MNGGTATSEPSVPGQRVTALGRARGGDTGPVSPPRAIAVARGRRPHSHTGGTDWLRDVILGGQDGLVNILGITLGVISGGGSRTVLLAAGFSAAITRTVSRGSGGYTS